MLSGGEWANLHAPLRPRLPRRVALAAAGGVLVVVGLPALVVARSGPGALGWVDRLGFVSVAVALAWALTRFASVRAVPSESGLLVRNLLITRRLDWPQVVEVRFGGDTPWAVLDLDDGDTLAVMAVQRADGAYGQAQARRLATLVALHNRTPGER